MSENEGVETGESFADMLARHEAAAPLLRAGQKVGGKVIAVSGDSVFVDLGIKQDGVMDRAEILDAEGNETVGPGDTVEAFIVALSPQGPRLSRSMTGSGVAALEEARDARIPVEGRVRGACKGGYQISLMGKTAFCPGSQMELLAQGDDPVGREMRFLVTKVENHGRNIVVSRRALIEMEKRENLDKLLASLNIDDTVDGKVSRLAPFGAFVELAPSVEGLVHISELSWSRLQSADEAVSVGDVVRVKVTGIDKDDRGQTRIGLSIRKAQGDPWKDIAERFAPGDTVDGKVCRLAPFGAFVEIAPGLEGLAHISEFSWEKRIVKPDDFLAVGDHVNVKIREIIPESRRISLSIRDAQGDPWQDMDEKFVPGALVAGTVESNGPHGLFVTIAPGITGLMPRSALAGKLAKLGPGDTVDARIRAIDRDARRISLAAVEDGEKEAPAEKDWRQHVKTPPAGESIMAMALQKAMAKK